MALHFQFQSRLEVGAVTADQMREVDRIMVDDLHIELVQMMENAGRSLARLAMVRFEPASAAVYVGSGGNGGGGLVAARHLANRGVDVTVVLSRSADELTGVVAHQLDIVQRMGIAVTEEPVDADLGIDALVGYGLDGDPRDRIAELIDDLNSGQVEVLALDVPSGVDATTGRAAVAAVEATATLTLALPKVGLLDAIEVGDLYVADISVPPSVLDDLDVGPAPDFSVTPIVRLM